MPSRDAAASPLADRLHGAAAALDGVFAHRAKAFVAAGDELIKAVSVFHSLTALFETLPATLSGDDLRQGADTLEQVADDCVAIHDLVPTQVRAMEALAAANVDVGKRLDLMRSNIEVVASIAVNARIEASALKSNSQDMLTFTFDVAKLAATAEATVNQYSVEQRKAHEVLLTARAVLTGFASNHRSQLQSVAAELRRSLQSIEGRRATALNEAASISERSRKISASIGTLITALQIADITSQRFAHVHEAVDLLTKGFAAQGEPGEAWWSDLTEDEKAAVAAQVASLQLAQIESALQDLGSETQSIRDAISRLTRDAAAMSEQGAALYGSSGDAAHSFLGELAGRIDTAGSLLSSCQTACEVVSELNGSVGSRFGALHDQAASLQGIVGIVGGVRLIGLNAHLKSDGLGAEGRTLSAISRELRSSADFITAHARDLIKSMDHTIALFVDLQKQNSAMGAERMTGLNAQMRQALSAFEDSGTQLASALKRLSSEGDTVSHVLNVALERMRINDDLDGRLETATSLLREIAGVARDSGQTARAAERAKQFFAQRYTMSAERNVHSAQTTAGAAVGSGSALADAGTEDLDSILF